MSSSVETSRSPEPPLRVAFLVEELGRSGGMAVVRRYARHLADVEGWHCKLVVCGARDEALPPEDHGIEVVRPGQAVRDTWDIAVATWWTTAETLFELDARRRALFLQNIESRFYRPEDVADRLGAQGVLDLPIDFIVIASHMETLLRRLRPDVRCLMVRNAIDKSVFRPAPLCNDPTAPLRVLVEGQPTLWFKGVQQAVAAVRSMRQPATVTVAAHDAKTAAESGIAADRVVGGLDPFSMAALYAKHDVLLKLSRFEGSPLPILEAFHVGVPCVVTPFTGSEEWAAHGENCLVVGFDDAPGARAALDLLARDRDLLARLRAGALHTAEAWPDLASASSAFARAVRRLCDEPPPADSTPAMRRIMRSRRLWIEAVRERQRRAQVQLEATRGEVRWHVHAYQQALETIEALAEERAELRRRPAVRIEDAIKRRLPRRRA
jgi:glycosyltransferase involved in cell wall biosynthesis